MALYSNVSPITIVPIPSGASLILDANTLSGATSPDGTCSVSSWNDSSGAGNNGTINCATGGGFSGSGIPSDPYRVTFNGLSTSVTTTLNAQNDTMPNATWLAWVKPTSTAFQHILSIDNHSGAFNRSLVIDNNSQRYGIFNPFNSIWTTQPVEVGKWQFIAVTFTLTDLIFQKNEASMNLGSPPSYISTPQTFTIGRSAGGLFYFYAGAIGWIAVYPRALTAEEIQLACLAMVVRFEGASCYAPPEPE